MTDQPQLPFDEDDVSRWKRLFDDGTYPTNFWEWIRDNRQLLAAFIELAVRAQQRGISRWSADAICHIIRWETALREGGQNHLKVNNNSTAGLARLAMSLEPRLVDFFTKRAPPGKKEARRLLDGRLYTEREEDHEHDPH